MSDRAARGTRDDRESNDDRNPTLRERPSTVVSSDGIYGVRSASSTRDARALCPRYAIAARRFDFRVFVRLSSAVVSASIPVPSTKSVSFASPNDAAAAALAPAPASARSYALLNAPASAATFMDLGVPLAARMRSYSLASAVCPNVSDTSAPATSITSTINRSTSVSV